MTLHKDASQGRSKDELGALVQWSLRESVAGASPPDEVWERIQTRANHMTTWKRRGVVVRGSLSQGILCKMWRIKDFTPSPVFAEVLK